MARGGNVDRCLVLAAEESNWLLADALCHFERATVSSGAGAVCLTANPRLSMGVELDAITDAHTYRQGWGRRAAAQAMRGQLPASAPDCLLVDGVSESLRSSAAELDAWRGWMAPG